MHINDYVLVTSASLLVTSALLVGSKKLLVTKGIATRMEREP